jgi:hypothetical protein
MELARVHICIYALDFTVNNFLLCNFFLMIKPLPSDKAEFDIVQMHRCKLVLRSWKGFFEDLWITKKNQTHHIRM